MEWKETARWIKFEEDVEESNRWGKPHVASLTFHSLLELRKGLEKGEQLFFFLVQEVSYKRAESYLKQAGTNCHSIPSFGLGPCSGLFVLPPCKTWY